MKKVILISGGIIIVLIVVGIIVIGSNIGGIIKKAVNTYGPDITKTELRLGDVNVSIFSGSVKLKDFFLGNPTGFQSPYAMKVNSVSVDIDLGSLTSDTIVINKIEIISPEISYEKSARSDNFQTIMNNVTSSSKHENKAKEEPGKKEEAGKKIFIKDFIIKQAKVLVSTPMVKRSFTTTLPDIHLQNIGGDKGGVPPSEAVQKIVAVLYQKLTSPEINKLVNENLKSLKKNIESTRKELESVKSPEEASKILKGLLGK